MSQAVSVLVTWRKSTRCESQHCVEVAEFADGCAVRNSTSPDRQITFTAPAWRAFITTLRTDGRTDA